MNIWRKIIRVARLIYRNKIILGDLDRKTKRNRVNIHWYSLKNENGKENFGDWLSVVIVENLKDKYRIKDEEYCGKTKHLYAIGSILGMGGQNATIWGSRFTRTTKNKCENNLETFSKIRYKVC